MTTITTENVVSVLRSQLRHNFHKLRFREPLEEEYAKHLSEDFAFFARIAGLLSAALLLLWWVVDSWAYGKLLPDWVAAGAVLLGGWGILMCGVLYKLPLVQRHMPVINMLRLSLGGVVVIGGNTVLDVPVFLPVYFNVVMIFLVFTYFFSLLTFRRSICIGGVFSLCMLVMQYLQGVGQQTLLIMSVWLLAYNVLGAVGGYMLDYLKRRRFLEQQLATALAEIDPLTRVLNRRALEKIWSSLQSKKNTENHAVVMIDVDYFKQVNDRLGHDMGDRVLKIVAKYLRNDIRKGVDYIGRYGGDEFVAIFQDVPVETFGLRIQQLREVVNKAIAHVVDNQVLCTVSFGVCYGYEYHKPTLEDMLHDADERMYADKQSRRVKLRIVPASITS